MLYVMATITHSPPQLPPSFPAAAVAEPPLIGVADGRVAPRSGLAAKNFIDTGAGVIDADYRGEVKVLLFNFSDADFAGTSFCW